MNGTGSSRKQPRVEWVIEAEAEKAHWNKVPPVRIRLIEREPDDDHPHDMLILRLESPQDDPEILEEYPNSVVVWQAIRLDAFDVGKLQEALEAWMNAE
jgi:hypothetical protein